MECKQNNGNSRKEILARRNEPEGVLKVGGVALMFSRSHGRDAASVGVLGGGGGGEEGAEAVAERR